MRKTRDFDLLDGINGLLRGWRGFRLAERGVGEAGIVEALKGLDSILKGGRRPARVSVLVMRLTGIRGVV